MSLDVCGPIFPIKCEFVEDVLAVLGISLRYFSRPSRLMLVSLLLSDLFYLFEHEFSSMFLFDYAAEAG